MVWMNTHFHLAVEVVWCADMCFCTGAGLLHITMPVSFPLNQTIALSISYPGDSQILGQFSLKKECFNTCDLQNCSRVCAFSAVEVKKTSVVESTCLSAVLVGCNDKEQT